jgi:hypothetical protein
MPDLPARPPPQDDDAVWDALLAEALRETGGALSADERAWADEILGTAKDSGSAR